MSDDGAILTLFEHRLGLRLPHGWRLLWVDWNRMRVKTGRKGLDGWVMMDSYDGLAAGPSDAVAAIAFEDGPAAGAAAIAPGLGDPWLAFRLNWRLLDQDGAVAGHVWRRLVPIAGGARRLTVALTIDPGDHDESSLALVARQFKAMTDEAEFPRVWLPADAIGAAPGLKPVSVRQYARFRLPEIWGPVEAKPDDGDNARGWCHPDEDGPTLWSYTHWMGLAANPMLGDEVEVVDGLLASCLGTPESIAAMMGEGDRYDRDGKPYISFSTNQFMISGTGSMVIAAFELVFPLPRWEKPEARAELLVIQAEIARALVYPPPSEPR